MKSEVNLDFIASVALKVIFQGNLMLTTLFPFWVNYETALVPNAWTTSVPYENLVATKVRDTDVAFGIWELKSSLK